MMSSYKNLSLVFFRCQVYLIYLLSYFSSSKFSLLSSRLCRKLLIIYGIKISKVNWRWFRWILIFIHSQKQTWLDWIPLKDTNCRRVLLRWKRHFFFNVSILIKIMFLSRMPNQFAAHFRSRFGLEKAKEWNLLPLPFTMMKSFDRDFFLALISIFYSWASHFYEVGFFNGRSFLFS